MPKHVALDWSALWKDQVAIDDSAVLSTYCVIVQPSLYSGFALYVEGPDQIRALAGAVRDAEDTQRDTPIPLSKLMAPLTRDFLEIVVGRILRNKLPRVLSKNYHGEWTANSYPPVDPPIDRWPGHVVQQLIDENVIVEKSFTRRTGEWERYVIVRQDALDAWEAAKLLFFAEG